MADKLRVLSEFAGRRSSPQRAQKELGVGFGGLEVVEEGDEGADGEGGELFANIDDLAELSGNSDLRYFRNADILRT